MMLRWPTLIVMYVVALGSVVACSKRDDIPAQSASVDAARPVEISRPQAETMEAAVAALVDDAWQELDRVISDAGSTAQDRADAYASFGLVAFGNGLVISAEKAFENATLIAPDDARWIYFLALIREYDGALEPAAAGFERVLSLRADDVPALLRLGDVRYEQARMEEARTAFGRALNVDDQSAAAHYGLGRVASALGDDAAAAQHFEQALALQPDASRVNYLLGLTWRNLGDAQKASEYLARRGDAEPAFEDPLFDELSGGKARIGGLWANMNAGSQALVDRDYETAAQEFLLATENHPDDPRSWQSLGTALRRLNNLQGAEAAYRRALSLNEASAPVQQNLAAVLIAQRRLESAEAHLLRAVEIDPQGIDALTTLAQLMFSQGRFEDALGHYDTALALDPQSSDISISRAEVLAAMDRADEAVAAMSDTVRINPRDVTARLAYAMMLSANGRAADADVEVDNAIDIADDDAARARAHFARGRIRMTQGRTDEAIASLQRALSLNPEHRVARLMLARTHARARDYEDALTNYNAMLAIAPNDDAVRIEAATAAILLKNGAEARRILEQGAGEMASPRLLSATARLLTLSAQSGVRDPDRGLEYARRAFDLSGAAKHAETVALCLAATGRFDDAIELQSQLVQQVAQRDVSGRTRMEENLRRYRARSQGRLPLDAG